MAPLGQDDPFPFSRRGFLRGIGIGSLAVGVAPLLDPPRAFARTGPTLLRQPAVMGAPRPEQLHVQFGADASRQAAVSWATPDRVLRPQLRLAMAGDDFGLTVDADERVYTEALTGQSVFTYHARLRHLEPDSPYRYQVLHAGSEPVGGGFRTGPVGRAAPFRFTSFGDQSVPRSVGQGLGPWSANAGYIVDAVEATEPLFHLMNGDLCYANVSDDPVGTWAAFFNNNMRSAAHRAWMPAAGNHENEVGNGPQGYLSYETRFALPDNGDRREWQGNWYTFVVGNVAVVSLNNDDVCLQDGAFSAYRRDHVPGYLAHGDDPYIHGYSGGAQKAWLEHTLRRARSRHDVDWIVVVMHQVAMSSAHFNGADIGIRQEWLPLFDAYGVDLVVAGHEHHFERTFAVARHLAECPRPSHPVPPG